MEIKTIQPLLEDKTKWDRLAQYLQELRQQIQRELEVATSVQAMYQCQGKLALVRQILNLQEANKHNKLENGNNI
jgi:plasmid rolling circle replication initiator protein Rep